MTSYKETAKQVVDKIGGVQNVNQAWHCVTRLRFNLHDKNKVQVEEIKQIKGVMGAQFSGDQFQVIIGNRVAEVFEEVEPLVGSGSAAEEKSGTKQGVVSLVMDSISGIFTPILPALIGAGMLKAFVALFATLGWLSIESDTYAVLNAIGDGVFYFLPFFLAVSAARKFKTNEYLALALAAAMLYPTFVDAARGITKIKEFTLFGINFISIPVVNYTSSVIPIILGVLLLKYVYKFVRSWMPATLTVMFSPLLTLLIAAPITLWVIGPLGTYMGDGVAIMFSWMFETAGPLAGLLLAGLMPLIIMTGMHYAIGPIAIQNLKVYGFDNVLMPMMYISNLAQGGAAFGVALKTKNKDLKQVAFSSAISAVIGITEPAMYGVNMKLKKPFYYAMASSALLGGFAGWYGFKAFTLGGLVGIFAIPTFADPSGAAGNLIVAVALLAAAVILPAVLVLTLGFKDIASEETEKNTIKLEEHPVTEKAPLQNVSLAVEAKKSGKTASVFSPLHGELVPLHQVSDATFAQEIMGKGIAIKPNENRVVSPIAGTVMVLPDSQHAIGIKGEEGEEILIHIGIDTVSLKGEHFKALVKEKDYVNAGQPLIEFDRHAIAEAGFETVTMVIITNTAEYLDVLPVNEIGPIFEGEQLLSVVK
ncbi:MULTISPECIES: beta-glucoside-specific PTS transporter subunit IIABC [unclassified Priestia]|uniref:beta-glucoside-specific PTS transporter subunit IIABC n=1 Tax=unclassified Priestia TaxID=2800374 RepID=UPI00366E9786